MKLEELPVELLALLFEYGLYDAVIALWKSGSRLLRAKMANGGVGIMCLEIQRKNGIAVLPQCLQEFHLRYLSIRSVRLYFANPIRLHNELKKMKPSLKRLVLATDTSEIAFFGHHVKTEPEAAVDPENAENAAVINSNESLEPIIEAWDWNNTFGALEELSIESHSNDPLALTSEVIALLPRSLTTLKLFTCVELVPGIEYSILLPHLATFYLAHWTVTDENLTSLPRHVTSLSGSSITPEAHQMLADQSSQLFPNLVELDAVILTKVPPPGNSSIIASDGTWPTYITKLQVYEGDAGFSYNRTFPSRLVSLELHNAKFSPTIDWIEALPETLESLKLAKIIWNDVTPSSKSWPSSLTSLVLLHSTDLDPFKYHLLPRTLKKLFVGPLKSAIAAADFTSTYDIRPALTAGLQRLQGVDHDLWLRKKQHMAELYRSSPFEGKVSAYFQAVESGALFGLPLTLTELSLPLSLVYPDTVLVMPPETHTIACDFHTMFTRTKFWSLLPPSVTVLRSHHSDDDGEPWEVLANDDPTQSALFQHTTLRKLQMQLHLSESFGRWLERLPRSLEELHSGYVGSQRISAHDLGQYLPPHLQSLSLHCREVAPGNDWASMLPRNLEHFSITAPLHGPDLKNLPPKLQTLRASLCCATLDHLYKEAPNTIFDCALLPARDVKCSHCPSEHLLVQRHFSILRVQFRPFWRFFRADRKSIEDALSINQPSP